MNKLKLYLLCLLVLSVLNIFCGKTKEQTDNKDYEWKTFSYFQRLPGCNSLDTFNCSRISIVYDQFINGTNIDRINNTLISYMLDDKDYANDQKLKFHTKNYFDSLPEILSKFMHEDPSEYGDFINEYYDLKINSVYKYFMTFTTSENWFHGGGMAHPNGGSENITLSLKTLEKLTVKDIFVDNYENKLNFRITQKLRNDLGLKENEKFSSKGIEYELIKFNNNFTFSNDTLIFHYNAYEIACYAAGPRDIKIPANDLKDILKDDIYSSLIEIRK